MKIPKRKFDITIKVDGHTWEYALRELIRVVAEVERHGPECSSAGGGGPSGHLVAIQVDPDMTEEKYEADLQAWAEDYKKRETQTAPNGG